MRQICVDEDSCVRFQLRADVRWRHAIASLERRAPNIFAKSLHLVCFAWEDCPMRTIVRWSLLGMPVSNSATGTNKVRPRPGIR